MPASTAGALDEAPPPPLMHRQRTLVALPGRGEDDMLSTQPPPAPLAHDQPPGDAGGGVTRRESTARALCRCGVTGEDELLGTSRPFVPLSSRLLLLSRRPLALWWACISTLVATGSDASPGLTLGAGVLLGIPARVISASVASTASSIARSRARATAYPIGGGYPTWGSTSTLRVSPIAAASCAAAACAAATRAASASATSAAGWAISW